MDKGKIIIIPEGFPTISETFVLDQITGLIDRGIDLEIWTYFDPKSSEIHKNVFDYDLLKKTKYLNLPQGNINDIEQWCNIFEKNNNIDMNEVLGFHFHFGPSFNRIAPLLEKYNKPFVVASFHGYDATKVLKTDKRAYDFLFERANYVTAPSEFLKNKLVEAHYPSSKIIIHRYGIDLDQFKPVENKKSSSIIKLLTVSRLVEKKGLKYTLNGLANLETTNWQYKIIGEGPLKEEVENLIEELNLSDRVSIEKFKPKDEIIKEMNLTDLFILTSVTAADGDTEGLPVSLTEAHAAGIPVISTYHAGIPELVINNKTGFLLEEKEINGITEAVNKLISDERLRKQFSENARKRAEEEFNIQKLNDRLKSIYDELCSVGEETFISICIPTYNRAEFLRQAIKSVIDQINFENYEIVIVDDGSTDNTEDVINQFNNSRIKYFKQNNSGRPKTRNRLIREATGEYILWLDDDDFLEPNILSNYSTILINNSSIDVVYCNLKAFDNKTFQNLGLVEAPDYSDTGKLLLQNLINGVGLTFPGSLIRKSLLQKQCGFNEKFLRAQDNELWARIATDAKFYKVNKPLYNYRKHEANISFTNIIDTSYESLVIKNILKNYELDVIYPQINLSNKKLKEEALYYIALGFFKFEDFHSALKILDMVSYLERLEFFELYIRSLIGCSQFNKASELIEKHSIKFKDFNSEVYVTLLNSIENLEQIEIDPKSEVFIDNVVKVLQFRPSFCYFIKAKKYELESNYKEAAKYYLKSITTDPTDDKKFNCNKSISSKIENKIDFESARKRILKPISFAKTTERKLISVILPTYNRPDKFKEAIQSILNQTYSIFEIIVVNDNGCDVSNVVNSFNDNRIKLIKHKNNQGLAAARNTGIKNAEGFYIAYLDDDDIFYPNHLETLVKTAKQYPDYKVFYTDSLEYFAIKIGDSLHHEKRNLVYSLDYTYKQLMYMNIAPVLCFMHEKSLIENKNDYFDETMTTHEDWDFWIKLANKTDFYHIKEITSEYRRIEGESGMTNDKLEDFLRTMKIIFNKYPQDDLFIQEKRQFYITNLENAIENKKNQITSQTKISVIIVTYNSSKDINECLTSVLNTVRDGDEVIVVDNNSQDNTRELVVGKTNDVKNCKLISNGQNVGFSQASNIGLENSSNPIVILLNPDTVVTNNWIERLLYHFNDPQVAAVGPISSYAAGLQKMELYTKDSIPANSSMDEIADCYYKWNKHNSIDSKLLIGFCLAIKKSALEDVGLLDPKLFLGNDDLDLSWRLVLNGYKLRVATDTFIFHKGQQSFKTEKKSKTDLLVQESTDILFKKLQQYYGEDSVPHPMDIWGMDWFKPTDGKFLSPKSEFDNIIKLDIVIPLYNQAEYTVKMLNSLNDNNKYLNKVILIDNNSNDETAGLIEKISSEEKIIAIQNKVNLGFPKAVNQGILKSTGNYVLIANNDIIIPPGAIERMIEVAESDPQIGIVGPISNSVSGVQIDPEAKYDSIEEMYNYAEENKKKNAGQSFQFPRVAFLCTLIKKSVIEKIGGLDERFSPGNYEDDDFCLRTQLAGYKTVIAKDVFVHHFGSKSFKADGENKYQKLLDINRKKFVEKWGADPDQIWLKGKEIKIRNYNNPISENVSEQYLSRINILIQDEDYFHALINIDEYLNYFENSDNESIPEIEKILLLKGKLEKILDN